MKQVMIKVAEEEKTLFSGNLEQIQSSNINSFFEGESANSVIFEAVSIGVSLGYKHEEFSIFCDGVLDRHVREILIKSFVIHNN